MKTTTAGTLFNISDIPDLSAVSSPEFKDKARTLSGDVRTVEIDLSQTRFVDSTGLGALFAIYKIATAHSEKMTMRLLNPQPPIQELFELCQLHKLFEIVHRPI